MAFFACISNFLYFMISTFSFDAAAGAAALPPLLALAVPPANECLDAGPALPEPRRARRHADRIEIRLGRGWEAKGAASMTDARASEEANFDRCFHLQS